MVGCRVMVWNRAENRFRWYHDGLDRQGAKALAKELAPSGITVNCVCPGVIETDMTKIFDEETLKDLKDKTLLKRLGTPKDIAKSASFLASKEADYITGQILNVSGGFVV